VLALGPFLIRRPGTAPPGDVARRAAAQGTRAVAPPAPGAAA